MPNSDTKLFTHRTYGLGFIVSKEELKRGSALMQAIAKASWKARHRSERLMRRIFQMENIPDVG